jgi:hypothetical protein
MPDDILHPSFEAAPVPAAAAALTDKQEAAQAPPANGEVPATGKSPVVEPTAAKSGDEAKGEQAAAASQTNADAPVTAIDTATTKSPDEAKVDYSAYKIGELLDGIKIEKIYLQYSDAIVFTSPSGGIHFRHSIGSRFDVALVEFYRLASKSTAKLNGAYDRQVNSLLGSAMAEALSLPDGADLRRPFAAVDEFIDTVGPVNDVFGAKDGWAVFIDKHKELVCDYPNVTDNAAPVLTEFYRLRELGKSSLEEKECDALRPILGTELNIALQRTGSVDVADAFTASRDYIQLRNESKMRWLYILSSLGAALVFALLTRAIIRNNDKLLLGALGGIVGAAISVLQRSVNLEIRRFLPRLQVSIQGLVRVTLGLLFSLIAVAAVLAKVINMAETIEAFFLIGAAAGFSERFVPDLLTKIASESSAPAAAKK